jgi:hypothetical protein
MSGALELFQLLNTAMPGVIELVGLIRRKDGSVSIVALLDEADAQFEQNMTTFKEWKANIQSTPQAERD